ncbi:MAG: hypothetical protein IH598_05920 [Bacteroidales bacterium]|nr:hypothetical protein [Bacteroidales bacterium]
MTPSKSKIGLSIFTAFFTFLLFVSCSDDKDQPEAETGSIEFTFTHYVDNEPLQIDTMKYVNAAGNHYLVNEIQYFISDVKLHNSNGNYLLIDDWNTIHYVDTDLPETHTWKVYDPIATGDYQKISFIFGISEEKNQSLMFVNPPERDMFWPEILGGGYHYLKLNGKWMAANRQVLPFNFHLGIGQIYSGGVIVPDSITGFIQNYFEVELPNSAFNIAKGESLQLEIRMNVANWFQHPHIYNHDEWGGDIMQNQAAMKIGCENGKQDVFSLILKSDLVINHKTD